ncbi:DNA ligase (ATP) [Dinochytrium kinnereticum]|nr:DNA ligase (ATP) [Dinochytrium kinnereticum]
MSSLAERFPFATLAAFLDAVQKEKAVKSKRKRMSRFVKVSLQLDDEWQESGDDFYPVLRLLVPHLDKDRATYGIKDKTMAALYIDILSIQGSADAESLINWKRPGSGRVVGDFGEVLQAVLMNRASVSSSTALSIAQVNEWLDRLNACDNGAERREILSFFATHCSAVEQKWLARVILKGRKAADLRIGVTENTVFHAWHPEAQDMFNVCSSLAKVARELNDLSKTFASKDITLGAPFKPMLAKSCKALGAVEKIMKGQTFWIQTKLDGERMQLHKEGDQYKWFSRNAKDYTHLYGEDRDEKFAKTIHSCFHSDLKSCILDGELMSYSVENDEFEGFGVLKTAANRLNEEGEATALSRPCFIVFDILYVNGQSLLTSPLSHRHRLLQKIITPRPTFLQILDHQEAKTTAEVIQALDQRMMEHLEGIIVKDPTAPYVLNERGDSWLKIKPDYIDSLGDDVDLLLVGGFFGSGRRSGKLSHFMCAVLDDSVEGGPKQFVSICKFGSGYTMAEIEDITHEGEGNWRRYDPKRPPTWFVHPSTSKERPDMIIAPEHSRVVCVKAAEIVRSEQYGVGWTLRFPRFVRIRHDKTPDTIMRISELQSYILRNNGRMQSRRLAIEDKDSRRVRNVAARRGVAATVPPEYRSDVAGVVRESEILEGVEVCVVPGATGGEDGKCAKHLLEKLVVRLGGRCVQNPRPGKTNYVIADKITGKRFTLQPRHMLQATDETRARFRESNDRFGDSYTENVTIDGLKECFDAIDYEDGKRKAQDDDFESRKRAVKLIAEVEERYFSLAPVLGNLFRRMIFYLDRSPTTIKITPAMIGHQSSLLSETDSDIQIISDNAPKSPSPPTYTSLDTLAIRIRCWGGVVSNVLSPDVTHVVVATGRDVGDRGMGRVTPRERRERFLKVLLYYPLRHERRPHVVTSEWVRRGIDEQSLPTEEGWGF